MANTGYTTAGAPRFSWNTALRWAIVAPASVALGWVFSQWEVPAAWIIAAIVVSGTVVLCTRSELPVNRQVYTLSRGFIGILAAIPLTMMPVGELLGYLPSGAAIALISVTVGVSAGFLLHRAQPQAISRETGILSMLPGGASLMPALADELGADFRYVALTQYLRLLAVSISLPVVVGFLTVPGQSSGISTNPVAQEWWMWLLVFALALVGEPLGKRVHLPVPSVLGPLLLTVVAAAILPDHLSLQPAEPFQILAFLAIGWVCGGSLSVPTLRRFGSQLPATVAYIAIVLGTCALVAWPLTGVLDITYFEAYLATSPGALETVLALSAEGGAGPAVVAIQLIRLIFVLAVAGYLPQLIRLCTRRK